MSSAYLYLHSFETKLGTIRTAATDSDLLWLAFPGHTQREFSHQMKTLFEDFEISEGGEINNLAAEQLIAYCDGKLKAFDLPLQLFGTQFQRDVLAQVANIKYGQTKTYGAIAELLGKPLAAQAVGSAVGRNNLPIIIPCHRVLASSGIGGFSGGLDMKRKLLQIENSLTELDLS